MKPDLIARELTFAGNAAYPNGVRLTYMAGEASTDDLTDLLRNIGNESQREWQDLQFSGLSLVDGKLVVELGLTPTAP